MDMRCLRLSAWIPVVAFGLGTTAMAGESFDAGAAAAPREYYRAQCAECHGYDGISRVPHYPNLRTQKKDYLVKAMADYKTGARQDVIMQRAMEELTDAEIDRLASYISGSLVCKPKPSRSYEH